MKYGLLVALLLAGCATGPKMRDLHLGMTQAQVVNTVGKPDGVQSSHGYKALVYSDRLMSGWSWDRADYVAVLKNNHLVKYGPVKVRARQNNNNNAGLTAIAGAMMANHSHE